MLGAQDEAIADCSKAILIDPAHLRSHLRLAKALCDKGDFAAAEEGLCLALQQHAEHEELRQEHARVAHLRAALAAAGQAYEEGRYDEALALFQAVEPHSSSPAIRLGAAKSAIFLGNSDRAVSATLQLIRADDTNVEAYAVRGIALAFGGEAEQGCRHLREALRLDPDHRDAARWLKQARTLHDALARARQAALTRQFQAAVEAFGEALGAGPLPPASAVYTAILAERAAALLRMQDYEACLADCEGALRGRADCKDAWITRASALMALGRPAEAQQELEGLLKMYEHDTVVRHWYDKADFEVRRGRRADYYACLAVSSVATEAEIKTAYKARALEFHPDKHSDGQCGLTSEEAEARFKLCGEALEILGDAQKRALYDQGYDKEGIEEKLRSAARSGHQHQRH